MNVVVCVVVLCANASIGSSIAAVRVESCIANRPRSNPECNQVLVAFNDRGLKYGYTGRRTNATTGSYECEGTINRDLCQIGAFELKGGFEMF